MGLTYSEVFVELSLDTVPCWVLSEKRKKVEAFSCPTGGSICLKRYFLSRQKTFLTMHISDNGLFVALLMDLIGSIILKGKILEFSVYY